MRLLLIDSHDSFTWNLAQYLARLGAAVDVRPNDHWPDAEAACREADRHDAVVLSPGPGRAEHAGVLVDLVRRQEGRRPILGVCLGHQAIALARGGAVVHAPRPVHGKTSEIDHVGTPLFRGLPRRFAATRYHSLVVDPHRPGRGLRISARSDDGCVMALEDAGARLWGVQFHPESILTAEGLPLLRNFLTLVAGAV